MSLFNCHKQEPQPWMSYISSANIRWDLGCCPPLVMGTDAFNRTYEELKFKIREYRLDCVNAN